MNGIEKITARIETDTKAEVGRILREAEEKAAQLTRQELERAGADCEVLKQNARGRLEQAAQLIVGRVVER